MLEAGAVAGFEDVAGVALTFSVTRFEAPLAGDRFDATVKALERLIR